MVMHSTGNGELVTNGSVRSLPDRHREILHELAGQGRDRSMEAILEAQDAEMRAMSEYLDACDRRSLAAARKEVAGMVAERTPGQRLRSLAQAEAEAAELEEHEAGAVAEELGDEARSHVERWQRLETLRGSLEKIQRGRG